MSRSFKDSTGHEWLIDFTFDHELQLAEIGVILDSVYETDGWAIKVATDRSLFAKMLLIVLEDQLAKHSVTGKELYKRLNSGAVIDGYAAMVNAAVFFSKGEEMAAAITESMKKVRTAQTELAAKQIESSTNIVLDGLSKSVGVSAA